MKKVLPKLLFATILFSLILVYPYPGFALTENEINKELSKIQRQEQEAAKKRMEAEKLLQSIEGQKEQEATSLEVLKEDLNEQGAKLNELYKQMNDMQLSLQEASQHLEEADERVSKREDMLKNRIRIMYMNGSVSYFDVLFGASSFTDFLERYQILQTIAQNDKELLESNRKDRELINQKRLQVEEQLGQVRKLYADAEALKQSLMVKENQKQVAIASLESKEKELEAVEEKQESTLIVLAKQKAEWIAKEKELKRQRELSNKKTGPSVETKQEATKSVAGNNGKYSWPVSKYSKISSDFGYRVDPISKTRKLHKGLDIPAPGGTPITAAKDGIVLIASWVNGYGITVVIDHGNGTWTWYAHTKDGGLAVKEGDEVKRGQKIAEVGSTGNSTGNHLHFEVRVNEEAVDPKPYL